MRGYANTGGLGHPECLRCYGGGYITDDGTPPVLNNPARRRCPVCVATGGSPAAQAAYTEDDLKRIRLGIEPPRLASPQQLVR